jgi:hypothetical protein
MARLSIVLPKETDDDLAVNKEVDDVCNQMAAEAVLFPAPPVKLEDIKALNQRFRDAIPSEGNRSDNSLMAMMELKRQLLKEFKKNSFYVLLVADGDRDTAARSGYRLNSDTLVKKKPGLPVVIKKVPGDDPGTIRLSLQDKAGCDYFIVELRNADGTYTMIDAFDRIRGGLVRNVPSGRSFIRLQGRKGNDLGPYTDDFEVKAF